MTDNVHYLELQYRQIVNAQPEPSHGGGGGNGGGGYMTLEALERELDTAREAIRDLRSDWRLLMGAFAIAFVTLAGALALGYLKLADKVEASESALRGEIRASAGDVKELINSAKTDSASSASDIKSDIKELRSLLIEQRTTKK